MRVFSMENSYWYSYSSSVLKVPNVDLNSGLHFYYFSQYHARVKAYKITSAGQIDSNYNVLVISAIESS